MAKLKAYLFMFSVLSSALAISAFDETQNDKGDKNAKILVCYKEKR